MRRPGSAAAARSRAGRARVTAPPSAANAGLTWRTEATKNPTRVSATTADAKTGIGSGATSVSPRPTRSGAENRRSTVHATAIAANHGSAIVAPKRAKLSPLARNAKRLVRFETGRSSEAEFARWVHAYACGLARSPGRGT